MHEHVVTNLGRHPIKITKCDGAERTILPGKSYTGYIRKICHGDGAAHYTVEAVKVMTDAEINVMMVNDGI